MCLIEVVTSAFEDCTYCHLAPGAIRLSDFDLSTHSNGFTGYFLPRVLLKY